MGISCVHIGLPVGLCARVCVHVYTCMSESICVLTYMHANHLWLYELTREHMRMHVNVCMNELCSNVITWQSEDPSPSLSDAKHVFLCPTCSVNGENSNWYFCLTLRSAKRSVCVRCFNWIKKRCATESQILRSKNVPAEWKWKLGIVISFVYVAADKPAGGEGGRGKKTGYRNNTFMCISSFHPKNLEAHFGVFYPVFPCISNLSLIIWGK